METTIKSHLRTDTGEPIRAQVVAISDFDIPFTSIVYLMVKLAVAAIPAALILALLGFIITVVFGAVLFGQH